MKLARTFANRWWDQIFGENSLEDRVNELVDRVVHASPDCFLAKKYEVYMSVIGRCNSVWQAHPACHATKSGIFRVSGP
ncbi:MAG: hypothetical protein ACRESZ_21225 [Methylococcales bacterium]